MKSQMISSTRNHWRFILAVFGSLLLHAMLLINMVSQPASLSSARQQTLISVYLLEAGRNPSPTKLPIDSAAVPTTNDNDARVAPLAAGRKETARVAELPRAVVPSTPANAGIPPAPPLRSDASSQSLANGYKSSSELDPPPRPLGDIELEYPPDAGLQQGTVVLRLLISDTGKVDDVVVLSADPPGVFDAAAVASFRKALFSPGRYLGLPVRSQVSLAVDYTPTNRGSAVSGQGGFDGGR